MVKLSFVVFSCLLIEVIAFRSHYQSRNINRQWRTTFDTRGKTSLAQSPALTFGTVGNKEILNSPISVNNLLSVGNKILGNSFFKLALVGGLGLICPFPDALMLSTAPGHILPDWKTFIGLAVYLPCLLWGLPYSRIGSWNSIRSNGHRIGGILTLIVPVFFTIWEAVTSSHVNGLIYFAYIGMVLANVGFGAALIPKRLPAYDIPTLRAFAVGVLLAISFTSLSLLFRFGAMAAYKPVGIAFASLSIYTVIFAWSDGLQHLARYLKGDYKEAIGKKWFLKFERPSMKHVFIDCIVKQPTTEALQASVTPANLVTVSTTVLTACFATIALLQTRFILSGTEGMMLMAVKYPHVVRWSVYEALLAVVANNFGTFAGTLVLQGKVSQQRAGLVNALGLLIPVFNLIGFLVRYPTAFQDLLVTSLGRL